MRRVYWALFVVVLVVVSVWLAIHYDVLTLARAFLAPAWRWLVAAGRMVIGPLWQGTAVVSRSIFQNYLLRRAESPVWALLTTAAVAVVGYRVMAKLTRQLRRGGAYLQRGVAWYRSQHRVVRWTVGSTAIFGVGFLGFGLFVLPVWIPLSGRLLQSLHFWWFDRVMARWVAPAQRRFRHAMRTSPFWRTARRPYRVFKYTLLVTIRRLARWLRRIFTFAHTTHAEAAPQP